MEAPNPAGFGDKGVTAWLKAGGALGYIGLIVINVGSGKGWFGPSNADISAKWPVPLTPAGWAFSIWGLIFLLQLVGVLYVLSPGGYNKNDHIKELLVSSVALKVILIWVFQCV